MAQNTFSYPSLRQRIGLIIAVVITVVIAIFVFAAVKIVDSGTVGVRIRLGNVSGILDPGIHVIVPFIDKVETIDVRVQKEQVPADSASKDLQQIKVDGALNFSIDPQNAGDLYRKIGVDYNNRVIAPAIQESVKASTALYTAEELITKRAEVKQKILDNLTTRLKQDYILVEDFSIVNFEFSSQFNQAIEAKQIAQQQVATEQNNLDKQKILSQQQITRAQADAESQRLQIQSLTQEFLQKLWIDKWNGVLPQVSGQNSSIINLNDLGKPVTGPTPTPTK